MAKIKGDYWKVNDNVVKIQMKTKIDQHMIEELLGDWKCVSYGYVPKTQEDIYVFEKYFTTENDWTMFLESDKITKLIEMREIKND
tara:strand:+ start:1834 stop:2091 length:258 start_codon:yes stop_codon:yes gene_type:complete